MTRREVWQIIGAALLSALFVMIGFVTGFAAAFASGVCG